MVWLLEQLPSHHDTAAWTARVFMLGFGEFSYAFLGTWYECRSRCDVTSNQYFKPWPGLT